MISAISKYMPRWLMAIIATALVLATLVGSNQDSAEAIDPADTDTVYIADGTNFADALMGATIASLNTSPMLGVAGTNGGDTIPGDTVEELDRLTDDKADLLDTIYIFGGTSAVSANVATQLEAWATNVERIAGDSRWGTYEAISQMLPSAIDEAIHAQEADNADTLDGQDSTDFLGATDKAADSELLDGMDSGDFALADDVPVKDPFAVAASNAAQTTSSTTLVDVSDATVDITIPEGHEGIIVARFTAESACSGGGTFEWCVVQIAANGTTMQPTDGQAFDSTDDGTETANSWEGHAADRSLGPLPAGTYTIQVQFRVTDAAVTFRLDDLHLTVEAKLTN